jgi:hypothetical protein
MPLLSSVTLKLMSKPVLMFANGSNSTFVSFVLFVVNVESRPAGLFHAESGEAA